MSSADRLFLIARGLAVVVVLLCGWLVYELASDPYEESRLSILDDRDDETDSDVYDTELPGELNYAQIQEVIVSGQRLWEPLVRKPKPPPKKPDLKAMTKDLEAVAVLSEGNELKCIIRDKKNNTHTVYKKGDKVRELTVDGITPTHVVLSYKGQTIKVSL